MMLKNLEHLSLWQRRLVFFMVLGGILMIIVAITWLLARQALTGGARVSASALLPDLSVREFAALPDDDAYPAGIAAAPDGTLYTGSYKTGVIWSISVEGVVTEIPGTREGIGAVSAIAITSDGLLLVVAQGDADPRTRGGSIVQVDVRTGSVTPFATIDDETGFSAPNDLVIDARGAVYVSDPGRNEIWRFSAPDTGSVWWVPPPAESPLGDGDVPRRGLTGLAYDAAGDAILVTDPEVNEIFRVAIADGTTQLIYRHGRRPRPPGFDGITVSADGTIYTATLGTNGVARVIPAGSETTATEASSTETGAADGALEYIAGVFRGASDVEYAAPNRLYVTNFDQASLAPLPIPLFAPQLPFALDVIELGTSTPG